MKAACYLKDYPGSFLQDFVICLIGSLVIVLACFAFERIRIPHRPVGQEFWQDLDQKHLPIADLNDDGAITKGELKTLRARWVKSNGLTTYGWAIYRDGKPLSVREAEELAGL